MSNKETHFHSRRIGDAILRLNANLLIKDIICVHTVVLLGVWQVSTATDIKFIVLPFNYFSF